MGEKVEKNKLPPNRKKIAMTVGISGILFLSGCSSVGSQYDVLDKVADVYTTGANTTERIQDYIEEHTSEEKSVLNQIVSKMSDTDSNDYEGVNNRPEYDPLRYVDVSSADISKITLTSDEVVTEKDVEDAIHNEMLNKNIFSDASQASKGDIVNIDYTATEKGSKEPFVDVTDEDRTVGDNLFPDEIDAKLVGVRVGDVLDIDYTYADDYEDEVYKGKAFSFHIKINEVKGMEITDDVASRLSNSRGESETVEKYKTYIKYLLEYKAMQLLSESGVNELCDMCTVKDYPEDVINYDIQCEFIRLYQEFNINGSDEETLLKKIQSLGYSSLDDFTKKVKGDVTDNLKKEMEVLALAKKYDLWLDDETLASEILSQTTGFTSAEDYYEAYSKYHAQYVIAKNNLAKEIQKNGKQTDAAG